MVSCLGAFPALSLVDHWPMNYLDTRATLLLKIRDLKDRTAWSEFVELYTPLLYSYAIKAGLQDADAADIAQESMCDVVRSIRSFEYDSSKGSFRGWLLTVTRNRIRKRMSPHQQRSTGSGDTAVLRLLQEQPQASADAIEQAWQQEYELRLFHWAAERVREEFRETTWQAFWKTTVENMSIEQAAASLELTLGAVYIARSRVLARLRIAISELEQ